MIYRPRLFVAGSTDHQRGCPAAGSERCPAGVPASLQVVERNETVLSRERVLIRTMRCVNASSAIPADQLRLSVAPMMDWTDIERKVLQFSDLHFGAR